MTETRRRCAWADNEALMADYHDAEWGNPVRDSRLLWETLMLEGFQAGLSWRTILIRREGFRAAFKGFDPEIVAKFDETDVERLMQDPGIIRARAKILATIGGAQSFLRMRDKGEEFADFAWAMVGGAPVKGDGVALPAKTDLSERMSKELKARGFKFVGPVIVYAWMQAVGLVDDHAAYCFKRQA